MENIIQYEIRIEILYHLVSGLSPDPIIFSVSYSSPMVALAGAGSMKPSEKPRCIDLARARAAEAGVEQLCSWVRCDMLQLPQAWFNRFTRSKPSKSMGHMASIAVFTDWDFSLWLQI